MKTNPLVTLAFQLHLVSSSYFMNLWTAQDCNGPPNVFVQYSAGASTPGIYYAFVSLGTRNDMCGLTATPGVDPKSCCVSSLVTANSFDANSTIFKNLDGFSSASYATADLSFANNFPAAGNGNSYCILESTTPGVTVALENSGNLWNFYKLFMLSGTNFSSLSCLPNGKLRIGTGGSSSDYANDSVATEYYQLTTATQLITSPLRGKFSAIFDIMGGGGVVVQWIELRPVQLFLTLFKNPWEIISVICLIVVFIMITLTLGLYTTRYIKKRNPANLIHVLSMTVWLATVCMATYFQYQTVLFGEAFFDASAFNSALTAFCPYFSVILTAIILVGAAGLPKWMDVSIYVGLTVVHLALGGAYYTTYWGATNNDFAEVWSTWIAASIWFNIFVLLFIQAPAAYLIYKVIIKTNHKNQNNSHTNGPRKRLLRLLRNDLYFTGLEIITLVSIAIYFILRYLVTSHNITFGSERVSLAFKNIRLMFFFIPFLVNVYLLDHLPNVIANRALFNAGRKKSTKKTKTKAVINKASKSKAFDTIELVQSKIELASPNTQASDAFDTVPVNSRVIAHSSLPISRGAASPGKH